MQQPTKANAKDLFDGKEHYVIPAYQRPYVSNEEDQWAPLWEDVVRVTESHLNGDEKPLPTHFLGAVVFRVEPGHGRWRQRALGDRLDSLARSSVEQARALPSHPVPPAPPLRCHPRGVSSMHLAQTAKCTVGIGYGRHREAKRAS
jgi:hypothetical protein